MQDSNDNLIKFKEDQKYTQEALEIFIALEAAMLGQINIPEQHSQNRGFDRFGELLNKTSLKVSEPFCNVSSSRDLAVLLQEIFVYQEYYFDVQSEKPYIIDCGANVGLASIYFSIMYPNAEILAVEMNSETIEHLKRYFQSQSNTSITYINKAVVGDAERYEVVSKSSGDPGAYAVQIDDSSANVSLKEVQTIRLSSLLDKEVDILKLDIEGQEYSALLEAGDALKNVRNIFVEWHIKERGAHSGLADIIQLLESLGFELLIRQSPWAANKTTYQPSKFIGQAYSLCIFGKNLK